MGRTTTTPEEVVLIGESVMHFLIDGQTWLA
jgi:hypothetical protein